MKEMMASGGGEARPSPSALPALKVPTTIRETGLTADLLVQLMMKVIYFTGEVASSDLADRMKLPFSVVDELMNLMRAQNLCEVKGVDGSGKMFYRYGITSAGRERTREFLEINQYTGPAPVTLEQYTARAQEQSVLKTPVGRDDLERGFTHLVLSEETLNLIGEAINAGRTMFLYGPSGNGKTIVAESIGRIISRAGGAEIFIPYALEVDGQIIQVWDPVNHVPIDLGRSENMFEPDGRHDARWVLCRRPVIFVGGELTLNMLDLVLNPIAKYYEAPQQIKANGGVFIIDDFGRQLVKPSDLLNRWIVPLEKRQDYLTLHTGKKFPVPFDSLVIFATNLEPSSLMDEAFFRRIRFKMAVNDPSLEDYAEIFKRCCAGQGIEFRPETIDYLQREYYRKHNLKMRRCHPRDLIDQLVSVAKYLEIPATLSKALIDKACQSYFILEKKS